MHPTNTYKQASNESNETYPSPLAQEEIIHSKQIQADKSFEGRRVDWILKADKNFFSHSNNRFHLLACTKHLRSIGKEDSKWSDVQRVSNNVFLQSYQEAETSDVQQNIINQYLDEYNVLFVLKHAEKSQNLHLLRNCAAFLSKHPQFVKNTFKEKLHKKFIFVKGLTDGFYLPLCLISLLIPSWNLTTQVQSTQEILSFELTAFNETGQQILLYAKGENLNVTHANCKSLIDCVEKENSETVMQIFLQDLKKSLYETYEKSPKGDQDILNYWLISKELSFSDFTAKLEQEHSNTVFIYFKPEHPEEEENILRCPKSLLFTSRVIRRIFKTKSYGEGERPILACGKSSLIMETNDRDLLMAAGFLIGQLEYEITPKTYASYLPLASRYQLDSLLDIIEENIIHWVKKEPSSYSGYFTATLEHQLFRALLDMIPFLSWEELQMLVVSPEKTRYETPTPLIAQSAPLKKAYVERLQYWLYFYLSIFINMEWDNKFSNCSNLLPFVQRKDKEDFDKKHLFAKKLLKTHFKEIREFTVANFESFLSTAQYFGYHVETKSFCRETIERMCLINCLPILNSLLPHIESLTPNFYLHQRKTVDSNIKILTQIAHSFPMLRDLNLKNLKSKSYYVDEFVPKIINIVQNHQNLVQLHLLWYLHSSTVVNIKSEKMETISSLEWIGPICSENLLKGHFSLTEAFPNLEHLTLTYTSLDSGSYKHTSSSHPLSFIRIHQRITHLHLNFNLNNQNRVNIFCFLKFLLSDVDSSHLGQLKDLKISISDEQNSSQQIFSQLCLIKELGITINAPELGFFPPFSPSTDSETSLSRKKQKVKE
jgi:hypothetical protein